MKPDLNPQPHRPPHSDWALRAKKEKDRRTIWRALLIGGFAVLAVFGALEGLKTPPPEKQIAEAKLLVENEAPVAIKQAEPKIIRPPVPATKPSAPAIPPEISAPAETAVAEAPTAGPLDGETEMLLTGSDSQRDQAVNRDRELLARTIESKAWDDYRTLLGKSIKAGIPKLAQSLGVNRFDPLWNEPVLYQALLRWKTLACFSESEITPLVADRYTGAMITWLLNNNEAMEELLLTFHPKDDGGKVLKFLMEAWSVNEDKYAKYFSLALACAVVFDENMPIPHPIGTDGYPSEAGVDALKRYLWYIDKNEKGKLTAPVHHQSARDLVWVVCAPVTTSELEWAIDKLHYRRGNWGDTYGSIEYLMERAVEGLNPYKEYSFAEILKEGGICGDQSYFCVNTARAQGIPAMTIAGETDLGGHAWAGVKIDDDEWSTGIGRVGGASKGQADNPQTRDSITEQEIQLWSDRFHQSELITRSVFRHLWSADYFLAMNNPVDNAASIRLANQLGRSFTETWRALYSLLERETQLAGEPAVPKNLDDWKNFASSMRREYKDNPRMAELAANAELEYIFPYGPEGDAKRTLVRERRRIERDSGEQKDLIASSLKREAELIHKRGGSEAKRDISRLYDRALRDFGGSITGFKMMAEDYFGYFKDDPELSRKAARDIELAFKRVVETGTKDWFRANTEAGIYRMICGYYRSAGDTDRAEMMEKRMEVLLKRSKRTAL